jgi:hypothetical protein
MFISAAKIAFPREDHPLATFRNVTGAFPFFSGFRPVPVLFFHAAPTPSGFESRPRQPVSNHPKAGKN